MLTFYLFGVFVVEIISIIRLFVSISVLTSVKSRNMKKIGLFYNIPKGTYTEEPASVALIIFTLFDLFILTPLLSWLSVLLTVWQLFKSIVNKTPIPEKIKEIQYQLSSAILPTDKVHELANEMRAFFGLPQPQSFEDGNDNVFVAHTGTFNSEFEVIPSRMLYNYYYHTDDYDVRSNRLYEYKFEGYNIFIRLLEDKNDNLGEKTYYDVKDNVVLESDIREREKSKRISFKNVDEIISDLKSEIDWHELKYNKLKYFIFSKHREKISIDEYRKILRQDLERIKIGVQKINEYASQYGFTPKETEYGLQLHYPENATDEEKGKLNGYIDANLYSDNNLTNGEYTNSKDLIEYIENLLKNVS